MKKIILLLISLIFSINLAHASNIMPQYTDSVAFWGMGLVKVGETINIYKENEACSEVIEVIKWNEKGEIWHKSLTHYSGGQIFVAFLPEKKLAFLSVDDEDDEWIKVCYDQKFKKFGWIKKSEGHQMYFWKDFFDTYAKKNGLYLFRNIDKTARKLYAKPEDGAQAVAGFEYAKHITPFLMRGNWMLVKVLNYDNTKKTGWIKWRDETGRLFAFVNFE